MTASRLSNVDTAKALAIYLVVLGHVLPQGDFCKFIYAFHMPLFFVMSGLFLMHNPDMSLKTFVQKKFWRLYVPYLLYGLVILTGYYFLWFNFIIPQPHMNRELLYRVIGTLPGLRSDWVINCYLWFLPCLFVGSIIIKVVYTYVPKYKYLLILLLFGLGVVYNHWVHQSLPLSLDVALISLPFLTFGIVIMKRKIFFDKWWQILVGVAMLAAALCFNNVSPDMYAKRYGNYALYMLGGFGGTIAAIGLCSKVPALGLIQKIGRNTLHIYALHFCIQPFLGLGLKHVNAYGGVIIDIYAIVASFITVLILLPICEYINRHIPVLSGLGIKNSKRNKSTGK